MTKQQEILRLDAFIKALGPHSYLGPWLTEYRDQIVADISNDVTIDCPLPGAARQQGAGILISAHERAEAIEAGANEKARRIVLEAQAARGDLKRQLLRMADELWPCGS